MINWEEKPSEIKSLLNPAFCTLILFEGVKSYRKKAKKGMPYEIAFILLPLILNRRIAKKLPQRSNARLDLWVKRNIDLKYAFMSSAINMKDYVSETIFFGLKHNVFEVSEGARLIDKKLQKNSDVTNDEGLSEILNKANLTGKWLANNQNSANLFSTLGIRP